MRQMPACNWLHCFVLSMQVSVQGMPSSVQGRVPGMQDPAEQCSAPLQKTLSSQERLSSLVQAEVLATGLHFWQRFWGLMVSGG